MGHDYFQTLNYTLANEDATMERAMVPSFAKHVFAVCGSGSRCLPLILDHVEQITLVDVVQEQLWLAELRIAAMKMLQHEDFLEFMGYVDHENSCAKRQDIFVSLSLTDACRQFFQERFRHDEWQGIIYQGKWERTITKIARVNQMLTGKAGADMFLETTDEAYQKYMAEHFPQMRWNTVLGLMGNASVFNALLYKGDFPRRNHPFSSFEFYRERFAKVFAQGPARHNYMLQLLFFGKIRYLDGLPAEAEPKIFAQVKAHLNQVQVRYLLGNILDSAQAVSEPIDFFSFSDVPSYFAPPLEQSFIQAVRPSLRIGGIMVIRNYQHIPWRPDMTGFTVVTGHYQEAIRQECTQVYDVDVLRRDE
ncbi:MAG: DUF3419 family protein [Oligoflexus sp.]